MFKSSCNGGIPQNSTRNLGQALGGGGGFTEGYGLRFGLFAVDPDRRLGLKLSSDIVDVPDLTDAGDWKDAIEELFTCDAVVSSGATGDPISGLVTAMRSESGAVPEVVEGGIYHVTATGPITVNGVDVVPGDGVATIQAAIRAEGNGGGDESVNVSGVSTSADENCALGKAVTTSAGDWFTGTASSLTDGTTDAGGISVDPGETTPGEIRVELGPRHTVTSVTLHYSQDGTGLEWGYSFNGSTITWVGSDYVSSGILVFSVIYVNAKYLHIRWSDAYDPGTLYEIEASGYADATENVVAATSSSFDSDSTGYTAIKGLLNEGYVFPGYFRTDGGSRAEEWWKLEFQDPVSLVSFSCRTGLFSGASELKFQGSSDDSSWTDLYTLEPPYSEEVIEHTFTNENSYLYYRLRCEGPDGIVVEKFTAYEAATAELDLILSYPASEGDVGTPTVVGGTVDETLEGGLIASGVTASL